MGVISTFFRLSTNQKAEFTQLPTQTNQTHGRSYQSLFAIIISSDFLLSACLITDLNIFILITLFINAGKVYIENKGQPKVDHTRNSVSKGSGFYLTCGLLTDATVNNIHACFKECRRDVHCKSFSFSHRTNRCYTNKMMKNDKACTSTSVNAEGFTYFEMQ